MNKSDVCYFVIKNHKEGDEKYAKYISHFNVISIFIKSYYNKIIVIKNWCGILGTNK